MISKIWQTIETEHYLFHYPQNSFIDTKIDSIAAYQEQCYAEIHAFLNISPSLHICYFLCTSPEEVGEAYGDNEPCNGFAAPPDTIYAVFNETCQCIGYHEDAHLISYHAFGRPQQAFIREGLAMHFDRVWHGIPNESICRYFLDTGRYIPITTLIDDEHFYGISDWISYPIAGAFASYLLQRYDISLYITMFRNAVEERYFSDSILIEKLLSLEERDFCHSIKSIPYAQGLHCEVARLYENIPSIRT